MKVNNSVPNNQNGGEEGAPSSRFKLSDNLVFYKIFTSPNPNPNPYPKPYPNPSPNRTLSRTLTLNLTLTLTLSYP